MTPNSEQELYNKAFLCWEKKETTEAIQCIDQALALAPKDLAVHALAMHIKRFNENDTDFLLHAEFIMEHDIHYRDTIESKDPNAIIAFATFGYSCILHDLRYPHDCTKEVAVSRKTIE